MCRPLRPTDDNAAQRDYRAKRNAIIGAWVENKLLHPRTLVWSQHAALDKISMVLFLFFELALVALLCAFCWLFLCLLVVYVCSWCFVCCIFHRCLIFLINLQSPTQQHAHTVQGRDGQPGLDCTKFDSRMENYVFHQHRVCPFSFAFISFFIYLLISVFTWAST